MPTMSTSVAISTNSGELLSNTNTVDSGVSSNSVEKSSITSTNTTITKSSSSTAKRSRKSDPVVNYPDNQQQQQQYLPIAPQQAYFQNQGLTLASVHQQLQPGSVAVFSSPTMAMAGQNGQNQMQQQQLVVAAPGQTMSPAQLSGTFNTANGQSPQIIQAQSMGMMGGIPQMQVIQAGANGQPTYFQPFYTNQMQPMLLGGNLTMAIQAPNTPQGLAIQIPNGANGGTMIATNQQGTPVKSQNGQQQPMIKSVTISPQQPQATKSSVSGVNRNQQTPQPHTPTFLQQTAFQQATPNQTFVIGTIQGSAPNANGAMISAATQRKSPASNRSSSTGTKASNMVQKIQPATSNMASPILTSTQFKPNAPQYPTTPNAAASPANSQTIMVHGQNGIQLTPNHQSAILSPLTSFSTLQPGITWATAAPINQQSTQLVAPNGQFFIRAQGPQGEQQHMLFQTANNQFQTVQMQMPTQVTQQSQTTGTVQMTQAGQQIVASSVNQTLPISIQANQAVSMTTTAIVTQQQSLNTTIGTTMRQTSNTTQAINTPTTSSSAPIRQRLIRPAGMQSSIATQTSATKTKAVSDIRNSNSNVLKLAPKVASTSIPSNLMRSSPIPSQGQKIIVRTKTPEKIVSKASAPTSLTTLILTNTTASKSSVGKVLMPNVSVCSTVSLVSFTTLTSSIGVSSTGTLVTNTSSTQTTPKVSSSIQPMSKVTSKKVDKKDAETKTSETLGNTLNKIKTCSNPMVNGIGLKSHTNNAVVVMSSSNTTMTNSTQMINGVLCQIPPNNAKTVNGATHNGSTNGAINGTVATNVKSSVTKPKHDGTLLTHVIDGFIIMESDKPFPIGGFCDNEDKDKDSKENKMINGDLNTDKGEDKTAKESSESVKVEPAQKDAATEKPQQPPKPATNANNIPCLNCGKSERQLGPKKKKYKRFCSQSCHDTYMQSKPKVPPKVAVNTPGLVVAPKSNPSIAPTSSLPILGSVAPTAPQPQPPLLNGFGAPRPANMLVPVQFATQAPLVPNTMINVVNGQMAGVKRTQVHEAQPKPTDIKRPRTSVTPQTTELPTANGATQEPKPEDNKPVDNENSVASILDGLWLPDNGNKEPNRWSVQDVYDFVFHLEGCSEFAEEFRSQEIDGQALMLIKEDHIIAILNMKLGPALKVCRKIKDIKSAFSYQ